MFQITTNSTLPDIQIQDKQLISIPCFYLTNESTSTFISDLTNFAPMFTLESSDEEVLDIEDFSYILSTIPSEYQMLEIGINDLQPLEDGVSTLYLNGSRYQNLLEIENLVAIDTEQDTLSLTSSSVEEREST